MSIFKRKKKRKNGDGQVDQSLVETRAYNINDMGALLQEPKTDPGFRSATLTIRNGLDLLDRQIEEKKLVQRTARKITETVRDMDLRWSLGRSSKKAT